MALLCCSKIISLRAFYILKFETVFLFDFGVFFVVNFLEKHIVRAAIEAAIAIKCAVDDHFLSSFGMIGDVFEKIKVTFEMAVNAVEFKSAVVHLFFLHPLWWFHVE